MLRKIVLAAAITTVCATGALAQIAGKWTNGSVGAVQYQNRVTGSTKPGRGSVFSYKFNATGTYEFIGYMEVSMYNCTTTLFNQITGRYKLAEETLKLTPSRDFWKSTNSCAASSNKEQTKTPTNMEYQVRLTEDEYGNSLLCLADGEGETCYKRDEDQAVISRRSGSSRVGITRQELPYLPAEEDNRGDADDSP